MKKSVRVSKSLVERLPEVFKDHIGSQIYLSVASSHIRSQFFNAAILRVINRVREVGIPKTAALLCGTFYNYGHGDRAAQMPWHTVTTLHHRYDPPTSNYERELNIKHDLDDADQDAKRMKHFEDLMDALKGKEPFTMEAA